MMAFFEKKEFDIETFKEESAMIKQCRFSQKGIIAIGVALLLLLTSGCSDKKGGGLAELKITFHDTLVEGSTVSRIDMTVLQTEIIDINDNKLVISSERHTFNLLELTQNNPVVLAHTMIAPGIYKQIRLILDSSATITLTNGIKHPLKVPSGEQTGIKIDGVFSIPAGTFYTLDIDLDPGQSVHYAAGQGYMLKPVITISGSDVNVGNFFYAGNHNNHSFVTKLNANGTLEAKTSQYSRYVITGYYIHDGVNRTLTIVPQEVTCPGCSRKDRLKMKLFADVPPTKLFNITSFGVDHLDLKDPVTGEELYVFRVPAFSLGYVPPTKDFTVVSTLPNPAWAGKTIVAQIWPEEGEGRTFLSVNTIPNDLSVNFDFSIPKSEFDGSTRNYILMIVIVNEEDDLVLSSSSHVSSLKNIIAHNSDNAILLQVSRDTLASVPLDVPFIASTL